MLLLCTGAAGADNYYSARVTFTANPFDGGTLTLNGNTVTFRNSVTSPATEVLIGPAAADTAANLAQHLRDYPINGVYAFADITSPTNVVVQAERLNFAITGSVGGAWGTVTVSVNAITLATLQLPLSGVNPASFRTNQANNLVVGMLNFATTNWPENASLLGNFVGRTSSITFGNKTITNSVLDGSTLTNVTLRRVKVTNNVTDRNGIDFVGPGGGRQVTIAPDASGIPTFYDTLLNPIPTNELGAFSPSAGNILTRAAADGRYGQFTNNNVWTGSNKFTIATVGSLDGFITNAAGYFTNIYVTNLYSFGPVRITNNNPEIYFNDANGLTDEKNTKLSTSPFRISTVSDDGGTLGVIMSVDRSGISVDAVNFPGGVVKPVNLLASTWLASQGNAGVAALLGIGTTNPATIAGMNSGIFVTNDLAPTANPLNGFVIWSEGGEPKFRNSSGGSKFIDNISGASAGSGSDYNLTATYAQVTFGTSVTLPLPSAGTYLIRGLVAVDEDPANANDPISVKFYNATDAADIAASERTLSNIPAGKRAIIPLENLVTVTGPKTIQLWAKNGVASRGSIDSEQTSLVFIRLN